MFRVFDVFLVWILTLYLPIQGGEGPCSPAKRAECVAVWRTCVNERCGACFLEIDGECYNPNYAEDGVLERLENCDPSIDAECKRSLEDLSEQLSMQLGKNDEKDKSTKSEATGHDTTASTLQDNTKVVRPRKLSENVSKKENGGSEGLRADENLRKTSGSRKKDSVKKHDKDGDIPDVYFLIIIIACTLSGVAGIALSGYCWYKLHYSDDNVNKSDYIPGVKKQNGKTTPSKNGDQKLDYKAEMYHYVHTKNQIHAMEKAKSDHLNSGALSNDEDDDDETEDYTVYECPGLAPTGDMTVVNPLFSDQEVSVSDEGRAQSTQSSPTTPSRSNHSPSR